MGVGARAAGAKVPRVSIYLIRHGETPGNRDRIVQVPETPLSERGLDQARRLAERLSAEPICRILASDLTRADMTAQALSTTLGLGVESEPLLQERNFGDLRGTPYAELEEDLFGPDFAPPGGETWEAFDQRVDAAWIRICSAADGLDGHLAVVTHGLVLHGLAERHLVLPPEADANPSGGQPRAMGNTCLTIVDFPTVGEAGSPGRVSLFGCTRHLGTGDGDVGISGI